MDEVGWAAPGCDGLQSEVKYYQPALQNLLVKLNIQFCNLKSVMVNYLRSVGERERARENGWPFRERNAILPEILLNGSDVKALKHLRQL